VHDVERALRTCRRQALASLIRALGDFDAAEDALQEASARALLVSGDAMEQRLTRAKRKIRDAGIRYEVPPPHRLDSRLPPLLRVLYLVFNEGYAPTAGTAPIRSQLCEDAIRMARQLARAFRADPEARGLLALMLLQSARAEARFVGDTMVPLDAQDRTRWDHARIAEGTAILKAALVRHRPGPYQIQAAIAAVHCEAPSAEATDWPKIVGLYEQLYRHEPTPVVRLNHAAACVQAGDFAPRRR
jgi:RNA polymerase sigma-70 factor (ECF subfamily)